MVRDKFPRFDDGASARGDFRDAAARGSRRGDDRKTMQLCAQVRRTLDLTLMGEIEDPVLLDLSILDVTPAPDQSRLRARVRFPAGRDPADLSARLVGARPVLLQAVADSIHRRKLPDIVFELVEDPAGD